MRMGDCFLCVLGFLSAKLRGSPLLPALRPDPQQLGGPPRGTGGEEPVVPGSASVRETGLGGGIQALPSPEQTRDLAAWLFFQFLS